MIEAGSGEELFHLARSQGEDYGFDCRPGYQFQAVKPSKQGFPHCHDGGGGRMISRHHVASRCMVRLGEHKPGPWRRYEFSFRCPPMMTTTKSSEHSLPSKPPASWA